MRYLVPGLALAGAALLALVLLQPFGGSNGTEDTSEAGIPGGDVCERPLPALSPGPLTKEKFDLADAGLDQTIRRATEGDAAGARLAFLTQVHDFTHDLDAPLRDADERLAKDLCKSVARMEEEFAFRPGAVAILEEAEAIRDLMRRAAEAMGYGE